MSKFATEIDWNDAEAGREKRVSDFMKLDEGENIIRVMSNPIKTHVHWVKTAENKDRKITSPEGSAELVRRLEEAGFKKQPSYMIKILDRKDDVFKLLEVGPQIFKGIQLLNANPKWANVTNYDISITKGPKGQQPLYNVTPNPKERLDGNLINKYQDFNDRVNLDKLTSPMPEQEILKLLGWQSEVKKKASDESSVKTKNNLSDFDFDE